MKVINQEKKNHTRCILRTIHPWKKLSFIAKSSKIITPKTNDLHTIQMECPSTAARTPLNCISQACIPQLPPYCSTTSNHWKSSNSSKSSSSQLDDDQRAPISVLQRQCHRFSQHLVHEVKGWESHHSQKTPPPHISMITHEHPLQRNFPNTHSLTYPTLLTVN